MAAIFTGVFFFNQRKYTQKEDDKGVKCEKFQANNNMKNDYGMKELDT